jgi:hypothetical protein
MTTSATTRRPRAAAAAGTRKSPLRTATLAVPADALAGPSVADVLLAAGRDPHDPVPAPELRRMQISEFAAWLRARTNRNNARDLPAERVRALMAWSPERPVLFPTSLRANLRVGAPHATDGQIVDLLGRLLLGPWLDRLESGLDTVLAPWAHPVSGGERQRLSVARAILAGRPVLLLDEATSHLDAAAASAVLAVVLEHAADRSLLWVTHCQEELAFFPEVRSLDADPG